jgi:phosphoenolpyruvate-protein kinase (PTS system EI component)
MDRGHPELAAQIDSLHPAVLRLIARTAEAARARHRTVAVCGGTASDPVAVPILIGLGVTELSVVAAAIGGVKAVVASVTTEECRELAQKALAAETAEAVRSLVVATTAGCVV